MQPTVCPTCGQRPRNRRGQGAIYVQKWVKMKAAAFRLLGDLVELHADGDFEKTDLFKEITWTPPDAISGRISELLGLKLIDMRVSTKNKQKTDSGHNTPAVYYRVNLEKATAVIKSGGLLNVIRQETAAA